jgi:LPS O-antigen subunit length determinant protein (WzzB/FepE family)
VIDLVELSPVALKILDEIMRDHRPQPQPAPRSDASPDRALLFLLIVMIGEIVGVIKILFD